MGINGEDTGLTRNEEEFRTLAQTVDHILRVGVGQALDLMAQWFKVVEVSPDVDWCAAKRIQLLPESSVRATPLAERKRMLRMQASELRLKALRCKEKSPGKGRGAGGT